MLPQTPHFHRAALFILLLFFLFLVFFYSFHPFSSSDRRDGISPTVAQRLLLALSSGANASIAFDLRALTLHPHLAGTPAASFLASYVLSHFRSAGLRSFAIDYSPLLSYPASASLSLLRSDGSLLKSLSLTEPADPFAASVPPYHAYSPSGAAVAPAVYVNFGREEDYVVLHRMGIEVKGCVAIARRGGEYRGAVVARAAAKGAKALLIFKAGDLGGVERGTVLLGGIGDPLTPGWAAASDEGGERLGTEEADVRRRFPKIPSMPVAEVVALEILNTLGGPTMPLEWKDDLRLAARRGLGPGPLLVNFSYQEDRKLAKIQNIFGVIWGREEPDRYVILGNHRDAWTFGAVDPNSGTTTLLDVARRYGSLLRSGWKPRRTIILCSWDAEEFGMIGSTEWVEQNLGWLTSKAVVYLNVDCAVQGDGFFAGASPQLDDLLVQVMKQVSVQFNWRRTIQYKPNYLQFRSIVQKPEPVNVKQHEPLKKHAQYLRIQDPDIEGTTVYDTWVAKSGGVNKIERLGRADSDFSAFLHIAGVPSIDMFYGDVFTGYHTALDNYKWMSEHGDPSFNHHVAIAEIWGLLGLRLADDPVLPFDYLSYATQLHEHATALITLLDEGLSLQPLNTSIDELTAAIREVQEGQKFQELEDNEYSASLRRRAFNDRLMLAERGFLEAEGLQGRPWFKHLLYSPPEDSESKFSFFPGIADAISQAAHSTGKEAQLNIQREIWRVARAIQRAAAALRGEPI